MCLFARNGFSGTTTREIARAAGVNEAIIFRFFPHKDGLYAAILERKSSQARSDALVDELRAAAARSSPTHSSVRASLDLRSRMAA